MEPLASIISRYFLSHRYRGEQMTPKPAETVITPKWMRDSPTADGWYWWRDGCKPIAVRVTSGLTHRYGFSVCYADCAGGEWWPIPIPEPGE
jgi:hypothetical protein